MALPLPVFSALTEDEAIQLFMSEMKEKQYHGIPIECLLPKSSGYKNAGYTIELFKICGESSPSLISRWRIDANSSKTYRQNEKGKYVSPSYVERANILRVNTTHPYHWLKVLLLKKIPSLHKWISDISKNSKGKVLLSVELDAAPNPESNNEYDVNYYRLRLGEAHEEWFTIRDFILIHRLTKEIMIEDILQETYIPLSSWERLK